MSITIPKPGEILPTIAKTKAPIWVIAAVIIAQYAIGQIGNVPEPSCSLTVHNPHYSSSMRRNSQIDSIKVDITSNCTQPQVFTEVTAQIEQVADGDVSVHVFQLARQGAIPSDPLVAEFKNLWMPCQKGKIATFIGTAHGYVHLKSGKVLPVSGSSKKYHPEPCRITAN